MKPGDSVEAKYASLWLTLSTNGFNPDEGKVVQIEREDAVVYFPRSNGLGGESFQVPLCGIKLKTGDNNGN